MKCQSLPEVGNKAKNVENHCVRESK